jgi:hypothetical protein
MSAYSLTDVLFTIPHSPAAVACGRRRDDGLAALAFRALLPFVSWQLVSYLGYIWAVACSADTYHSFSTAATKHPNHTEPAARCGAAVARFYLATTRTRSERQRTLAAESRSAGHTLHSGCSPSTQSKSTVLFGATRCNGGGARASVASPPGASNVSMERNKRVKQRWARPSGGRGGGGDRRASRS